MMSCSLAQPCPLSHLGTRCATTRMDKKCPSRESAWGHRAARHNCAPSVYFEQCIFLFLPFFSSSSSSFSLSTLHHKPHLSSPFPIKILPKLLHCFHKFCKFTHYFAFSPKITLNFISFSPLSLLTFSLKNPSLHFWGWMLLRKKIFFFAPTPPQS